MKNRPRPLRFWIALVLTFVMSVHYTAPALAGLAPSRSSGDTSITSVRDADLLTAQRLLENKIVGQKLRDYGVTPEAAQLKLATMSDEDLHTLASTARGLPSGADGTGAIIGVLIVVILVIVILRLLRHDAVVR